MSSSPARLYLPLAAVACVAVAVVDASIELGVATAVLYVGVVWLAYQSGRAEAVVAAAVTCGFLTILGLFVSPTGGEPAKVIANRSLALVAIAISSSACVRALRLLREAAERAASLERARAELARGRRDDRRKARAMTRMMEDLRHEREKLHAESERRRRLAVIVESSHDAIVGQTADGVVTTWNLGAVALYGYTAEEMIGRPMSRLVPPEAQRELYGMLDRVHGGHTLEPFETVALRKDGSRRHVSVTMSASRSEERPSATAMIVRDITERKRLEEGLRLANQDLERRVQQRTAALSAANAALEQSNVELGQFAYVASHDLQTPLRTVAGFAQLLERRYAGQLDGRADEYIEHIVRGTVRMRDLIKDLLEYSRVSSADATFRDVSLTEVFREVRAGLVAAIDEAEAEVSHDPLPIVRGDRSQLSRLLQNLIANGIKYRGDAAPRIHVSAAEAADGWQINVRDNGIGIAPEHHEQVFEIFRRLHGDGDYPGTGIGLAICGRIVQRHGGRIWIESAAGDGCAVCFTLPDASAEPAEPDADPGDAARPDTHAA